MRLLAFLTCAFLMLLVVQMDAADRQTVPGTSWSIVPPDGFELALDPLTRFSHPSGAMLLIIDSPLKPLDIDGMAKPGTISGQGANTMRIDEVRETAIAGRRAVIIRGYATVRDLDMYSAYIEGETTMGTIIASIPKGAAFDMTDMEKAVQSAIEVPKPIEERMATLPYRLDDLAGMRVASLFLGVGAILTEGPEINIDAAIDQPFATVFTFAFDTPQTISIEEHAKPVKDRIFAQDRTLAQPPGSNILDQKMIDTPRGPSLEITYAYKDKKTGRPMSGVAWLRAEGNNNVFVICHYPEGGSFYGRLARVRDGVTQK